MTNMADEFLTVVAGRSSEVTGSLTLLSFSEVVALVRRAEQWSVASKNDRVLRFESRGDDFCIELSQTGLPRGQGTIEVSAGKKIATYTDKSQRDGPIQSLITEIRKPVLAAEERQRQDWTDEAEGQQEAANAAAKQAAEALREKYDLK